MLRLPQGLGTEGAVVIPSLDSRGSQPYFQSLVDSWSQEGTAQPNHSCSSGDEATDRTTLRQ